MEFEHSIFSRTVRPWLLFKFGTYRGSLPYANFITANFITAIFQNFPDILGLCVLGVDSFITLAFFLAIFGPKIAVMKESLLFLTHFFGLST